MILAVLWAVLILSVACCAIQTNAMSRETENKCKRVEKTICRRFKKKKVEFYRTKDLTNKKLRNRRKHRKIIVEVVTGTVINPKTGAGKADLSNANWYIDYKCVKNTKKGDRIVTYFVYNPKTNYIDDVIARYDVVVRK